jgi:hypothetical protein
VAQDDTEAAWRSALIAEEPAAAGPKCRGLVNGVSDEWCKKNCNGVPRFCPASQCDCLNADTRGTGAIVTEALAAVEPTEGLAAAKPTEALTAAETTKALAAAKPAPAPQPGEGLTQPPQPSSDAQQDAQKDAHQDAHQGAQQIAQQAAVRHADLSNAKAEPMKQQQQQATTKFLGHYEAESPEDESGVTDTRHSLPPKQHRAVSHATKKLHVNSAKYKTAGRSQKIKTKLLCASSPCLPFCPLDPACDISGRSAEANVINATDLFEEYDETEVVGAPPTRKAHHASRVSKHRRGATADIKAERREQRRAKENLERKNLHEITDKMTGRGEERRASKESEERKKLDDLHVELCAEDPCQAGCPPNMACSLVASAGIDGTQSHYDGVANNEEEVAEHAVSVH